jgi:CubicO group peptidase (beta-lactamase class C family)
MIRLVALAAFVMLMGVSRLLRAEGPQPHGIPHIRSAVIDGDIGEWGSGGSGGFCVNVLVSESGELPPDPRFRAKMRLGWDEKGLLVALAVDDPTPAESENIRRLFEGDAAEFFVAPEVGDPGYYMLVAAPGRAAGHGAVRTFMFDKRDLGLAVRPGAGVLTAEVAAKSTDNRYTLEARLPWANLGITPQVGVRLGFQVYVMDSTGKGQAYTACWYPKADTHLDRTVSMMALVLAEGAGPTDDLAVRVGLGHLRVVGDEKFAGAAVEVKGTGVSMAAALTAANGLATAEFAILPSPKGQSLAVTVKGVEVDRVTVPGSESQLYDAVEFSKPEPMQYLFRGRTFPRVVMRDPKVAERLVGSYTTNVRYFDKEFREVATADRPGRYGAVIEVRPEGGRTARRFVTLCRAADDAAIPNLAIPYWKVPMLDEVVGMGGGGRRNEKDRDVSPAAALRLAALDGGASGSVVDVDRAWWLEFKRRFYHDTRTPVALARPVLMDGPAAPELRSGSPAEARMAGSVVADLEKLCDNWVGANRGQGFVVCAARDGVVFFHHAYGRVDGAPMTLDTPCPVTSMTKVLSGTLMMMFVDQGLIGLDDRVAAYLPALAGHPGKAAMTIRMLYTHTSGLSGHYGDEFVDLSERVSEQYDWLPIPTRHLYNGLGFALGSEVMETVSNTPRQILYDEHLLKPLGLTHTTVTDSHQSAVGTALDFARVGQMLAAGGRYGRWQFFSRETFSHMVPAPLVSVLGEGTEQSWGIGLWSGSGYNFGDGAYGHPSSNSSYLWFDTHTGLVFSVASRETTKVLDEAGEKQFIDLLRRAVLPGLSAGDDR